MILKQFDSEYNRYHNNRVITRYTNGIVCAFLLLFISACSSYKSGQMERQDDTFRPIPGATNVFLVGDAGKPDDKKMPNALRAMQEKYALAGEDDILIFLGDNVYQNGIPEKESPQRAAAELAINVQIEAAKNFPGKSYFIPGNHDWYSGLKGLKRQEKMVEDALGKEAFLPDNGCPLELIEVNDSVSVVAVDSHWYVTDWDNHPEINLECEEINSREKFLNEFASMLNKQQDKTLIIALHHPFFTNGTHDAEFPVQLTFPIDFIRKTTGISNTDLQHPLYREMVSRISTIIQDYDYKAVLVSGHEHNLQYIERDGIKQIVSGSGSKRTALRRTADDFGFAGKGFAILQITDRAQTVYFYDYEGKQLKEQTVRVLKQEREYNFPDSYPKTQSAAIYPDTIFNRLPKGGLMTGKRYRSYYGEEYEFPVAMLDTLYGGLEPVKLGGGFQTISLRLLDQEGREYQMRRLRKSATQFLQKELFRDDFVEDDLKGSLSERFIMDFYTASYPFAFLTIGDLSDAVGIYHPNPKIFYVPKQEALGEYNEQIGDDLYMIEERPAKEWKELPSFGKADDIESSDDVVQEILADEDNRIDKAQYIKTRLFDMWVGDWDRHSDQVRWAVYEDGNKKVYQPIPRDRDHAFPRYDGLIFDVATTIVPPLRKMQTFDDNLESVKYNNVGNYQFDLAILQGTTKEQWEEQARYLQQNLTDEAIEKAFTNIPAVVQNKDSEKIKQHLKNRRQHILTWARKYHKILTKQVVVTATDKDDFIDVDCKWNGDVEVMIYRNKDGERKEKFFQQTFSPENTKQIWIYGLNDKDEFTVSGERKAKIDVYLVGGAKHDTYNIHNRDNIHVFDYASKENTYNGDVPTMNISNDYVANNFDYTKFQLNSSSKIPQLSYDPDGGVQVGLIGLRQNHRFNRKGFAAMHQLGAKYYTATNGVAASYKGRYRELLKGVTVGLDAEFSTPTYTNNFFGYGNNTAFDDDLDFSFYRVRRRNLSFTPSLIRESDLFSTIRLSFPFERIDIDDNEGRIIPTYFDSENLQLNENYFVGAEASYIYDNADTHSIDRLGMQLELAGGYKQNIENESLSFGYVKPDLIIHYPIVRNGDVMIATNLHSEFQFADEVVPFYQATSFGGVNGLRGFRNERFTGENGFYHSTDLRFKLSDVSAFILPGTLGVYGGFDYGKVWMSNENYVSIEPGDFTNDWQTSYGGGMYVTARNLLTIRASYFGSADGGRISGGLGFDF